MWTRFVRSVDRNECDIDTNFILFEGNNLTAISVLNLVVKNAEQWKSTYSREPDIKNTRFYYTTDGLLVEVYDDNLIQEILWDSPA